MCMLCNLFPSELIILYSKKQKSHIYLVCVKTFPFLVTKTKTKNVPGGPFNQILISISKANTLCMISLQYTGNNITIHGCKLFVLFI